MTFNKYTNDLDIKYQYIERTTSTAPFPKSSYQYRILPNRISYKRQIPHKTKSKTLIGTSNNSDSPSVLQDRTIYHNQLNKTNTKSIFRANGNIKSWSTLQCNTPTVFTATFNFGNTKNPKNTHSKTEIYKNQQKHKTQDPIERTSERNVVANNLTTPSQL